MQINNNDYKGGRFEYLSEEQLDLIHMGTLEILETTGMKVFDDEALQLLADAGAFVDFDQKLAKLPTSLVEDAIASAPSKITLCDVPGNRVMHLYRNNVYYGLGTDLPVFIDPYTGEIRDTVLNDVKNVAKVAQVSSGISFTASHGLATDVPQETVDLYHLLTSRKYCSKPSWVTATDYGNMKALIDMAAISAGGYEELRRNPTIGVYNEPVSPLMFSMEATQKLLLCSEYGIPTTWASGIIGGGTGPMTVAGTLALGNAEGLGGLVIHQLKRKGSPFIFGIVASLMDMKQSISIYGGPELPLMHAVVGQLGRYYDLPSYGTSGCTDSNSVDAQTGLEMMYSQMMAALGGTNITHDNGYLGAGLLGSLETVLLTSEIANFIKRMQEGIEINDDTLCLELIQKIGPGGNFIAEQHTSKYFKKETFYPEFLNRKQYPLWTLEGKKTLDQVLNEKAKAIIEKEDELQLTEDVIKEYEAIIESRTAEIAAGKYHRQDFK
jgi:trimethylamine--corrinoid protein Co-methyltransferase